VTDRAAKDRKFGEWVWTAIDVSPLFFLAPRMLDPELPQLADS